MLMFVRHCSEEKEMTSFISMLDTTLKMDGRSEEGEQRTVSAIALDPQKLALFGTTFTKSSSSLGMWHLV